MALPNQYVFVSVKRKGISDLLLLTGDKQHNTFKESSRPLHSQAVIVKKYTSIIIVVVILFDFSFVMFSLPVLSSLWLCSLCCLLWLFEPVTGFCTLHTCVMFNSSVKTPLLNEKSGGIVLKKCKVQIFILKLHVIVDLLV